MVHEQLMTQKITPKNSPEQGGDLSGREGTEKPLLPIPISLAQLQEPSSPKDLRYCAEQGPCLHPMFVHLMSRNEMVRRERDPYSPPTPHPGKKKSTLGNCTSVNSIKTCLAEPCGTIKLGESPSQAGRTSWKLTSPSKFYKYLSLVPPGVTHRTILCFQQEAKFAVILLFVMIL